MADARAKAVLDQLVDTWSRAAYIHDIMTQLDAPLGFGDVVEVPSIADLTVYSNGSSSQSAQSITTSVLTLTADQHPWIPAMLPKIAATQLLDGAWAQQVAEAATVMLKSSIDQSIITYLRGVMIPGITAAGSFVDNLASSGTTTPALSAVAIYNSVAALENQSGANRSRFAWVLNPFAQAEIASLAAFIPAYQNAEQGVLGVPAIGSLNGLPVYVSPNVPRRRTVASTAYSITTNVETVTVAAGHQILPGMAVTFDTVTAGGRLTTSAVVSSVTATTVVFPNTTANSSATEAGTITIEACENHLLDLGHHYVAQQQLPSVRVVPDLTTTGDVLQVSAIYGRVARSGRGRILLSRATAS